MLVFWVAGTLNLPFALWIGLWATIGSVVGIVLVGYAIRQNGRPSLIVFILASVIAISSVIVPLNNIYHLMKSRQQGKNIWALGQFC